MASTFRVGSASRAVVYFEGRPCVVPNGVPLSVDSTDPFGFSLASYEREKDWLDLRMHVRDHWPSQQRAYPAVKKLINRKLRQFKVDRHLASFKEQTAAALVIQQAARSWMARRHVQAMLRMGREHACLNLEVKGSKHTKAQPPDVPRSSKVRPALQK